MWDVEAIAKATLTVGAPLATVARLGGRNRRLRHDIKENLALVEEIEKHDPLREQTLASGWLQGRIALDVARLTGQDFGATKKPIEWGSVIVGFVFTLGFALWTYWIVRDGFVWYSVFPGLAATVCGLAVLQMFTNRDLAAEERGVLPPGAVRAPTETASERVATAVAIAAAGGVDDRLSPGGQADVVLTFVKLLQLGAYEAGIALADENWLRCRVQAWLWNNKAIFGNDPATLEKIADEMLEGRGESDAWRDFVVTESNQFLNEWGPLDFDQYGIAGHRRRIAADLDLVILAPVGAGGGYFVMTATAVPNAMTFLVSRCGPSWRVANHVGIAPPLADWPPVWWGTNDPAIEALPEPGSDCAAGASAT